MRLPLTLIASSVVLAACGGGGGGGGGGGNNPDPSPTTSVTLTSANYIAVAQETLSTHVNLLSSASFVMSEQSVGTQSRNCTGGGTLERAVTDRNGNGQVDGGDSISMTAASCAEGGITLNGREEIAVNSGSLQSYPFNVSATVTYINLTTQSASTSVTGNGSITALVDATAASDQRVTLAAASFSMVGTYGGPSFTQTLQDYEARLEVAPAGGGESLTSRFSGSLSSTSTTFGSKSVSIQTDSPFVREGTPYPQSGTATITGAAGTKIRLKAVDAASVEIALDANADGIYETTVTKPWGEVL